MEISKSTIVRTILVLLMLVNFVLERMGIDVISFGENDVWLVVETAIEVGIVIVAWWKNNSFTPYAIKADKLLRELKESE